MSGSELYTVKVKVKAVPAPRWATLCAGCAGAIDSLVELLQGRLSQGVMERICAPRTGLFPAPEEIGLDCSCPDWASMCKHVAAVLYGIGSRLDDRPELLFVLRQVDEKDLIAKAGKGLPLVAGGKGPAADKVLGPDGLSELFGIEVAASVDAKAHAAAAPAAAHAAPIETRTKAKAKARVIAKVKAKAKAKTKTKTKAKAKAKAPVKAKATARMKIEKAKKR